MLRTHTCGELRLSDSGKTVTLSGWVQRIRDKGGMIWIDLRDRYGITQLMVEEGKTNADIISKIRGLPPVAKLPGIWFTMMYSL